MAYRLAREQFDRLVEVALRKIPKRHSRYFKNMSIFVEDLPSKEDTEPTVCEEETRLILVHEGGHYFGMSEEELDLY